MKLAVVGAGWAGLAAALRLQRRGHAVSVFEAARTPGGRARRVQALGGDIDNGQHILLGAYTETLGLMRELGLDADALFYKETLTLQSADGRFRMHAPALPAPLHLLAALCGARGLGWTDRYAIARQLACLRLEGWRPRPGLTVAQWLANGRQSGTAIRMLWQPLCVAALNTPADEASAQLFARVLRDSVGGPRSASDVLIPRVDLSALWPDRAASQLGDLRLGQAVRRLSSMAGRIQVDDEAFDGAIIACNTPSALRLLRQLPERAGSAAYLAGLEAFRFIPIATVTLRLARPWRLPLPMLMLVDDPARQHFGQWLFDKSALGVGSVGEALLHVVISDARAMQACTASQVVQATISQIREQTAHYGAMPEVLDHTVITEKRATFAATPGLARPANSTPWNGIWVAGDWTDTGYPGVLEGAVRSGRRAAELAFRSQHHF